MGLRERLLQKPFKEVVVDVDGDQFLVRSIMRVAKNEIVSACTDKNGKMDNARFEGEILAACVLDPETKKPVLSAVEWDLPSYITGPLVDAACDVCGFSDREKRSVKAEA